jgi:hypothetical protein
MLNENPPHAGTPTHADIITRNGGSAKVARTIGVEPNNVKGWKRLDSIPAPYWRQMVDCGLASYSELARAAEAKRAVA